MTMQSSPFYDIKYGWSRGEDGWNVGMDENMVKLSAMISRDIKGFVTTLPAMAPGDIYINTLDKKMYYNVGGTVYSVQAPLHASYFVNGVQYLWDGATATQTEVITAEEVGVTGAALMRAGTPADGRTALALGTIATQDASAFEPTITASPLGGSVYWNGNKSWVDFNAKVWSAPLTGFSTATSTAVVATDTVLAAFGKLQAQVTLRATLASPTFTGTPAAPTAALGTNTTQLATTAFVFNGLALKANLASPVFSGTPTAPTAAVADNSLTLANTAWVTTAISTKAPLASPTFTGVPLVPTAVAGTNTTQIASTAFVQTAILAVAASAVDSSKTANFVAAVGGNYWVRQNVTVTLPTETGRTIGDRVTLSKKISATLTITTANGTTPIVTSKGSDPIVVFDINATLIFVFNGTNWEV